MHTVGWSIAMAVALGSVIVLTVAGHPGTDYRHSDFFQFWAAPRLLLEGADPYDPAAWAGIYAREAAAPVATPPPPGRHIYPLWTAVPLLPLGAAPFDVAAAAWVVAQVVTVVLALRSLAALMSLERPARVLLFGFAAAFQPLWLIVGGGNVTGFMLGAFVAAFAATVRRAPVTAGGALGLLAMKPHLFGVAAPALALAAGAADRRMLVGAATVTVAMLVAITLPFGGVSWIGEWLASAFERQGISTGSNATIWTAGRVLPGAPVVAPLLAAATLVSYGLWWRARPRPITAIAAAGVAVSVLVAPHGWSYDQVLLLVPLAAILGELSRTLGARRIVGLALVAALAGPVPWGLYALAFARGGEEWSALTPAALFALLVLVGSWSGESVMRSRPELARRDDAGDVA